MKGYHFRPSTTPPTSSPSCSVPSSSALYVSTLENCQHPPALQPYTGFTGFLIIKWSLYSTILFFFFTVLCGPFLKPLLNLLQYCFWFMFCFCSCKPCGILISKPGIKPTSPALEGEVLTTGPQKKSLYKASYFNSFWPILLGQSAKALIWSNLLMLFSISSLIMSLLHPTDFLAFLLIPLQLTLFCNTPRLLRSCAGKAVSVILTKLDLAWLLHQPFPKQSVTHTGKFPLFIPQPPPATAPFCSFTPVTKFCKIQIY